jgi:glycosyltransferase involved in cell wall biosynthesis
MHKKRAQDKKVYRVGIDARFFGLENKGLGRYTNELTEWLDILNQNLPAGKQGQKSIKYYIFLREDNFEDYQPKSENIYKVKADYQWYSWQEQLLFPFLLGKYNLDLMHFTHFNAPIFYRGKFIVTIHDLILFHYPTIKNTTLNKFFYFFKLAVYHLLIRIVARRANLIIAISKFTKKDIVTSLKISEKKVQVIYEGAEFNSKKMVKSGGTIFKKYGILNKYLLYVGNAYPHKNLERLVLAFEELDVEGKDELQLILVGKKDYFYEKLEEFIKERSIKNVVITDYVADQELEELYGRAELFVFPSLYEGFGLPPLEALVKGLSVVSSAKSSLSEILGDKVRYFNPESVRSMEEGIEDVLSRGGIVLTAEEVRKIKNKYSWKKMTEDTLSSYVKIIC